MTTPLPLDDPEDDRLARLALSRLVEPGSWPLYEAVRRSGALAVWDALRRGRPVAGLSRALVAAAAAFAEERGVDQLVVAVHPAQREANRFFARLGLVPLTVRRSAPVSAVRRKLAAAERSPVEHVVRRRRRPERLRDVIPLPSWEGGAERRAEARPLFE